MRFELTTFSLARRRSTAELRPHKTVEAMDEDRPDVGAPREVDPVGFEPTISSVQGRRLPTRPRARAGLPLVPTRGLEPPRPFGQQILSLSRLPIPPRRRTSARFHRE